MTGVTFSFTGDYQTIYDRIATDNDDAEDAIDDRKGARDAQREGDFHKSVLLANKSIAEARVAAAADPILKREVFASLGQAARTCIDAGIFAGVKEKVAEMEEIELVPGGMDQYEMIFWPTIAASKHNGTPGERAVGFVEGLSGALASAIYFESKHLVKFPDRDKGLGWRVAKKAEYVGRNLAAAAANLTGSHRFAKIAVK